MIKKLLFFVLILGFFLLIGPRPDNQAIAENVATLTEVEELIQGAKNYAIFCGSIFAPTGDGAHDYNPDYSLQGEYYLLKFGDRTYVGGVYNYWYLRGENGFANVNGKYLAGTLMILRKPLGSDWNIGAQVCLGSAQQKADTLGAEVDKEQGMIFGGMLMKKLGELEDLPIWLIAKGQVVDFGEENKKAFIGSLGFGIPIDF